MDDKTQTTQTSVVMEEIDEIIDNLAELEEKQEQVYHQLTLARKKKLLDALDTPIEDFEALSEEERQKIRKARQVLNLAFDTWKTTRWHEGIKNPWGSLPTGETGEVWKIMNHDFYPDLKVVEPIAISNTGKVFYLRFGKIKKPYFSNGDYYVTVLVAFGAEHKSKQVPLKKLVAYAYPEIVVDDGNFECLYHKDGVKTNNHVNNLIWGHRRGFSYGKEI